MHHECTAVLPSVQGRIGMPMVGCVMPKLLLGTAGVAACMPCTCKNASKPGSCLSKVVIIMLTLHTNVAPPPPGPRTSNLLVHMYGFVQCSTCCCCCTYQLVWLGLACRPSVAGSQRLPVVAAGMCSTCRLRCMYTRLVAGHVLDAYCYWHSRSDAC